MDAASRLAAYVDLFDGARATGVPLTRLILPDLTGARYKLGTSASDFVLPYMLDARIAELFRNAALDLASLYLERNAKDLRIDHTGVVLEGSAASTTLKPPSYSPPGQLQNPVMRAAMERAPRILPGLDCGILSSWWGSGGTGRELLHVWATLLGKACQEMAWAETEITAYYLQFLLVELFSEAGPVIKTIDTSEPARREAHAAVLVGLHLSHHVVRHQTLAATKIETDLFPVMRTLWQAVSSPRVSFRSASPLLGLCRFHPVTADPLGQEVRDLRETLASDGPEALRKQLDHLLTKNKAVSRPALLQLSYTRILDTLVDTLACGIPHQSELGELFRGWLRKPRSLFAQLDDKKQRKDLQAMLTDAAKHHGQRTDLSVRLEQLALIAKRHTPGKPDLQLFRSKEDAVKLAGDSITADLFDQIVSRATSDALRRFRRRTGTETDLSLDAEYEAGRVYRIALDNRPFLRPQHTDEVAHFFIDLKDFTQRTNLLQSEVMAEFIREEFYEPILSITREELRGENSDERGPVNLNNLLGDAVSISGDVRALVRITKGIRKHLTAYQRKLDARLRASVHEMSAEETVEARKRGEVVAGSFISFGPDATVLNFDAAGWTGLKVSISEKINESARGTARNGKVLQRVVALLDYQRSLDHRMELVLPFRCYVNNFLELPLSPLDEFEVRAAMIKGDPDRVHDVFAKAAQKHVLDVMKGGSSSIKTYLDSGMALWNAGDALSGEALAAYCDEWPSRIRKAQAVVQVVDLEQPITERFAFFEPKLMLMALIDGDKVMDLFRFAGRLMFKGFEVSRATGIWEMLSPEAPITQMLMRSAAVKKAFAE